LQESIHVISSKLDIFMASARHYGRGCSMPQSAQHLRPSRFKKSDKRGRIGVKDIGRREPRHTTP